MYRLSKVLLQRVSSGLQQFIGQLDVVVVKQYNYSAEDKNTIH